MCGYVVATCNISISVSTRLIETPHSIPLPYNKTSEKWWLED